MKEELGRVVEGRSEKRKVKAINNRVKGEYRGLWNEEVVVEGRNQRVVVSRGDEIVVHRPEDATNQQWAGSVMTSDECGPEGKS